MPDQDRMKQWVGRSFTIAGIDQAKLGKGSAWMVKSLQDLGRLDVRLVAEERNFVENPPDSKGPPSDGELMRFNDLLMYSRLWVLGTYELVRVLAQETRADLWVELKRRFARLRMPLAKFEKAGKHGVATVAHPVIHPERGVAWQLEDGTVVTRRDLSDALLTTLSTKCDKTNEEVNGPGRET